MAVLKVGGAVIGAVVAVGLRWFIQLGRKNDRRNAVIDARKAARDRVQSITVKDALV